MIYIYNYYNDMSRALVSAAELNIPHTSAVRSNPIRLRVGLKMFSSISQISIVVPYMSLVYGRPKLALSLI